MLIVKHNPEIGLTLVLLQVHSELASDDLLLQPDSIIVNSNALTLVVTLELHSVDTVVDVDFLDLPVVVSAGDKSETVDLLGLAELETHPAEGLVHTLFTGRENLDLLRVHSLLDALQHLLADESLRLSCLGG